MYVCVCMWGRGGGGGGGGVNVMISYLQQQGWEVLFFYADYTIW